MEVRCALSGEQRSAAHVMEGEGRAYIVLVGVSVRVVVVVVDMM